MATIWGRATSSNVQLAMWGAAEVGLDIERIDAGGAFGGTETEDFKAMNPNGLVPVLKDGDLVLFESAAILRYLGAQYGSDAFWPPKPKQRAPLDAWAEWTKTTLCPVLIYQVFWTLVRTPKVDRDMEALSEQVTQLGELMSRITPEFANKPFLGSDHLSFADIMFGHTLYRYYTLPIERPDLPDLAAYYDRLKARPAYQEHIMVDYSSLQMG
ncbi:MAG: glutathione S-transferase family protein [Rhizobiaceae bacterium]|nr:glutathione S-transferase family protein [Rhizobiaceae bacterium]